MSCATRNMPRPKNWRLGPDNRFDRAAGDAVRLNPLYAGRWRGRAAVSFGIWSRRISRSITVQAGATAQGAPAKADGGKGWRNRNTA